jgi:hypothetical protein
MLSAPRASRSLTPGRFLVLISVRGWVDPKAIVWLEGLDQLKNWLADWINRLSAIVNVLQSDPIYIHIHYLNVTVRWPWGQVCLELYKAVGLAISRYCTWKLNGESDNKWPCYGWLFRMLRTTRSYITVGWWLWPHTFALELANFKSLPRLLFLIYKLYFMHHL